MIKMGDKKSRVVKKKMKDGDGDREDEMSVIGRTEGARSGQHSFLNLWL